MRAGDRGEHGFVLGDTSDGEREERRQRFGYDVFTEAERIRLLAAGWEDLADRVRGRADVRRVDIRRLESRLGRESRLGPAQLPPPRQISALTAPLTRPRAPAVPRLTR